MKKFSSYGGDVADALYSIVKKIAVQIEDGTIAEKGPILVIVLFLEFKAAGDAWQIYECNSSQLVNPYFADWVKVGLKVRVTISSVANYYDKGAAH